MEQKIRIIPYIAATFLVIGLFNLPGGYYTFLRIIVFVVSCICIFLPVSKESVSYWNIVGGIIAILFNPIIPIYFNDKDIWTAIDIVVIIYMVIMAIKAKDWGKGTYEQ